MFCDEMLVDLVEVMFSEGVFMLIDFWVEDSVNW